MSIYAPYFVLFLLASSRVCFSHQDEEERDAFLRVCSPATCGPLPIRFPFRLQTAPAACGFGLTCTGNDTLQLVLPSISPLRVTAIYYGGEYGGPAIYYGMTAALTVQVRPGLGSLSSPCPFHHHTPNISNLLAATPFVPFTETGNLLNCSDKVSDLDFYTVAVPCLSGPGYFVYVTSSYSSIDTIPLTCTVTGTALQIPASISGRLQEDVENFMNRREMSLQGTGLPFADNCSLCEQNGLHCGLNFESNRTFCYYPPHHGIPVKLITGAVVGGGGVFILVTVAFILCYILRRVDKEKETYRMVERFLVMYKTEKPIRYSFSCVKKMTKCFRHKLGQGGFASVYKGELPNGIPVGVKILERSKSEEREFINEVTTMWRIHHVNVVRLLGFCSEGLRHALIYEFMPNGSLDKFIFSKEGERNKQAFSARKLEDIATGIARGIEYLHQGCDQRILHFDIKPHNILLDYNFNPKISDFGLAKLCPRDHSIVTITAARGTMGYIAPEIYSRNFGVVSYKSDVYSFGVLVMEMVNGRQNVDPKTEDYFPEWVYNRLVQGEDLKLRTEDGDEEEILKKLVIVALWCIQWSPTDRPTMTKVIQLLMGNLDSIQLPPKPFVPSDNQGVGVIS